MNVANDKTSKSPMHVEFLVEDESMEAMIQAIWRRLRRPQYSIGVHPFGSRSDLIRHLPERLRAYRRQIRRGYWQARSFRVVVLVDTDKSPCADLKRRLDDIAEDAELAPKSRPASDGTFCVVNRLAVEELEAWFFGDIEALRTAFDQVPSTIEKRYRNPDAIRNTAEELERVLKRAGYYPNGISKRRVARAISEHMDPSRNRSKSFQVFRDAIASL